MTKPYVAPDGDESTWTDLDFKLYEANSKAQNSLLTSLNEDDLTRVIHCQSAYEIWQHVLVTNEGTSQVKRAKIDLLRSQYESFKMLDDESIDCMITRFTKITNALSSLGDDISNDQKAVSYTHLTLPTKRIV